MDTLTAERKAPDLAALRSEAWRLSPDTFAEHLTRDPDNPDSPPEWRAARHHRYLARKVRETILKPNGRLIVTMPPRHGKSELISRWSIAWAMALNPKLRVLLASYGNDFAGEWGRAVRNTLMAHADELDVRIASDSSAQAMWRTTEGGGMWTAGPGGTMTGRGGELVVLDDMHKNYAEAHSATIREQVWNFYLSVARTRLHKNASIIVVMTRWHEDDLVGRLLQNEAEGGEHWDVVNMPALAEDHEEWDLGNGEVWVRDEGDALWEEEFDEEALRATKSVLSGYLWSGLYQQHPSPPEGGLIRRDWWQFWSVLPASLDDRLISIDTTFKDGETTDYVVMQAWARKGAEFFMVEQIRDHMDYPTFKKSLKVFAASMPGYANKILVEESANGPAVIADMKKTIAGMVPRPAKGSKESRVHATSGVVEAGNVYLPEPQKHPQQADQVKVIMEEAAEFPNGSHDDTVDGWTQALLEWTIQPKKGVESKTAARKGRGGRRDRLPTAAEAAGVARRTTHSTK